MDEFIKIKNMDEKEERKIVEEIDRIITAKKREGLVSEREIREIEEMKLRPLPDIQDVQGVYEDMLFKDDS
ncbi:hypothetical protein KGY73_06705 [bacterium]|nr:hypothetical protein [bacterium]